ncbi:MAG: NADH-quinone oxidoreductase subunit I [Opitutae bacterium]|nr:NADH-quinone oxidoreductase subunit I [Opitutae bacterium]
MRLFAAIKEVCTGFWSLLTGLWITLGQFFRPRITVHYPRQTLKMPERFRGHIELILDPETGKSRCTACSLCERACPSECINVSGAKLDGAKTKSVTDYKLNFTTCSLCGSCIEACPFDALQFSKVYNVVGTSRAEFDNMDLVQQLAEKQKNWTPPPPKPAAAPAAPAAPAASAPAPAVTPAAQPAPAAQPTPEAPKSS